MYDVAWSPDGTRLVGVTWSGEVIQVTDNNAHSTVYKIDKPVCIMLAAPFFTYCCLVEWMRVQSSRDPCRRWR